MQKLEEKFYVLLIYSVTRFVYVLISFYIVPCAVPFKFIWFVAVWDKGLFMQKLEEKFYVLLIYSVTRFVYVLMSFYIVPCAI